MSRIRRNERRRAAAAARERGRRSLPFAAGAGEGPTDLHEERLDAVMQVLRESGARTVLDLGCGSGALLQRLVADPRFTRIVGVDRSLGVLLQAEQALPVDGRLSLQHGSFVVADTRLAGFDAAAMVETIEHVAPGNLSRVEKAIFADLRPRVVVLTTPNRDYNGVLGLADGEVRHTGHQFEWGRAKFQAWARGVGDRNAYRVRFQDIGTADPLHGAATQMAIFEAAEQGMAPGPRRLTAET